MAGQTSNPDAGSWSGVIINNNCSADEASRKLPSAQRKDVSGAKFVLYDDTTRQMYVLDPQERRWVTLGATVMTATGTREGDTIHLTSLKIAHRDRIGSGQRPLHFPLLTSLAASKPWTR